MLTTCVRRLLWQWFSSWPSREGGGPIAHAASVEAASTRSTDPGRRFLFDYPGTMKVKSIGPDEVQVFHPGASFRISVYIERRKNKPGRTAQDLLTALRKN